MKKRVLLLSFVFILLLAACSGGGSGKYRVGVCQLAAHPALDEATRGFQDALNEKLPGKVEFDVQNASNDTAVCATIANGFVTSKKDLILANATPALQAAAAATADIPILGTSVTEFSTALGVEDFAGKLNISGVSDLAPLDQQAAMIPAWCPEARRVGLLYCAGEANSRYQADEVQRCLEAVGIQCRQYSFADSNDMATVVQDAAADCDAIYVPTDNTCASNTGIIDNICRPAGVPVFAGEENTCRGCGVATLSVRYYDVGYAAGEMAAKILTGEAKIADMPVEHPRAVTPKYNGAICADLGLTPPEGYEVLD